MTGYRVAVFRPKARPPGGGTQGGAVTRPVGHRRTASPRGHPRTPGRFASTASSMPCPGRSPPRPSRYLPGHCRRGPGVPYLRSNALFASAVGQDPVASPFAAGVIGVLVDTDDGGLDLDQPVDVTCRIGAGPDLWARARTSTWATTSSGVAFGWCPCVEERSRARSRRICGSGSPTSRHRPGRCPSQRRREQWGEFGSARRGGGALQRTTVRCGGSRGSPRLLGGGARGGSLRT